MEWPCTNLGMKIKLLNWSVIKLRYRIHDKSSLVSVLIDRPAFDEAFCGKNPNSPINGTLEISQKKYIIKKYVELQGNSYSENEFHAIERDHFADVYVEDLR